MTTANEIPVTLPRDVLEALMQAAELAGTIGQQHADMLDAHGTAVAEARREQVRLMSEGRVRLNNARAMADMHAAAAASTATA